MDFGHRQWADCMLKGLFDGLFLLGSSLLDHDSSLSEVARLIPVGSSNEYSFLSAAGRELFRVRFHSHARHRSSHLSRPEMCALIGTGTRRPCAETRDGQRLSIVLYCRICDHWPCWLLKL
jgi:hypothetical protein